MFCSSCGKELKNEDVFCSSCGKKILKDEPKKKTNSGSELINRSKTAKSSGNKWVQFIFLVLLLFLLAVILIHNSNNASQITSNNSYNSSPAKTSSPFLRQGQARIERCPRCGSTHITHFPRNDVLGQRGQAVCEDCCCGWYE